LFIGLFLWDESFKISSYWATNQIVRFCVLYTWEEVLAVEYFNQIFYPGITSEIPEQRTENSKNGHQKIWSQ